MINRTVCTFALALALCNSSVRAQEPSPISANLLYPVAFQCGGSSEAFQEGVVRGMHATSISIHNPSNQRAVSFTKQVSRALPFQRSGPGSEVVIDTLPPLASIEIECNELRMLLPQSMTAQFRSGFLRIHATGDLNVVAVYSSRPHEADVSTIDVEVIEPMRLRGSGQPTPTEQPDLVVSDIDMDSLRISCPTGSQSCRASVEISVENIGAASSGPFQVQVNFDPQQTVEFIHQVPGLASGETVTFTANALTGGNCFDPDCRICAFADSEESVAESNEDNNKLCRERQG